MGVRSRRELVAQAFYTHYAPRFRDNEARTSTGRRCVADRRADREANDETPGFRFDRWGNLPCVTPPPLGTGAGHRGGEGPDARIAADREDRCVTLTSSVADASAGEHRPAATSSTSRFSRAVFEAGTQSM